MEVTIANKHYQATKEDVKKHFSDEKHTIGLCPVSDILDRISDKWSIHAIINLGKEDKLRFGELKKKIQGISQRMLTVTLRNLEEDGLVTRTVFPEIPPRVEYQLTEAGRGLLHQLMNLSDWASANMTTILRAREDYILKGK